MGLADRGFKLLTINYMSEDINDPFAMKFNRSNKTLARSKVIFISSLHTDESVDC